MNTYTYRMVAIIPPEHHDQTTKTWENITTAQAADKASAIRDFEEWITKKSTVIGGPEDQAYWKKIYERWVAGGRDVVEHALRRTEPAAPKGVPPTLEEIEMENPFGLPESELTGKPDGRRTKLAKTPRAPKVAAAPVEGAHLTLSSVQKLLTASGYTITVSGANGKIFFDGKQLPISQVKAWSVEQWKEAAAKHIG